MQNAKRKTFVVIARVRQHPWQSPVNVGAAHLAVRKNKAVQISAPLFVVILLFWFLPGFLLR